MELSQETTEKLYKNTIQYLHDISERVPHTYSILKSYYASKFQISQIQTKISLEKPRSRGEARCSRCCLKLHDTQSKCTVRAPKISNFAKKLLRRVETNKALTKFQAAYLKKNKIEAGNQLVTVCSFCKNEIVKTVSKPTIQRVEVSANVANNKRKAKRQKDQFCGLQKDAVMSALSQANRLTENCKTDLAHTRPNNRSNGINNNANQNNRKMNGACSQARNNVNNNNIKNKVNNNPINGRKAAIHKKQQSSKLKNMLQAPNQSPKSCLSKFLVSLGH